jgi:methionyl-tRNA formyltransferase
MKIIFMGTPAFAVPTLQRLINEHRNIVAVYTQPPRPAGRHYKEQPSPIHKLALANNIRVEVPASLKKSEAQIDFASYQADIVIVAAYGLILPEEILTAPKYGCINIHPSLLPRWRGAAPIQRTVLAGDQESAVCIMQIDQGLDTGDILLTERFPLDNTITAGSLHDYTAAKGAEMISFALDNLAKLQPVKQSEKGLTYALKLTKGEAKINWNKPSIEIDRIIRGFNPWPIAFCDYGGENIKIYSATFDDKPNSLQPGTIIDDQFNIACNGGSLRPTLIQKPGKIIMKIEDFLRGHKVKVGTILA